jgi:hypothetical protein
MSNLFISNFKKFFINLILLISSILILFSFLFQFYNPIKYRNNQVIRYTNDKIPDLPKSINVTYNNLGYIGEEFSDTITREKICFIGSSRTQSIYIPNEYKWTFNIFNDKTKFWVNNCGIDGSNINIWINEIKKLNSISPNYIIVLIDPFNESCNIENENIILTKVKKIQVVKYLILPIVRNIKSKIYDLHIGHEKINWQKEKLCKKLNFTRINLNRYLIKEKLFQLVSAIKSLNATPIFISCPTPYGNYTNIEGVKMNLIENSVKYDLFYKDFSNYLESFCLSNKIPFANGYNLDKSTQYFYDRTHFNINGSLLFSKHIKNQLLIYEK